MFVKMPKKKFQEYRDHQKEQWDFWQIILDQESWEEKGKSKEDVIALVNYFEGKWDASFELMNYEK